MAQQSQPQYEFHYQRVELLKTESLGVGSYGAVCKAMCDDLPCAAKILHPALFQFTAPGSTSVMRKFEQECHLLSAIKHPHVVQYLGTYCDPESKLPVLLMELMDESLTQFVKRLHKPLPYHTEVNLCHDIALALSYLHSNGIVHRDLSSNNVLLIAGSRAKVTDFGMVKLYDVNTTAHLTPLTLCPGTMVYMSPEALGEPPVYTDKLDSFSLGVLGVQIMTRQFPDPGNRFQIMEINDPRIPSGTVQVNVPETERRQSHIDMIDPAHPLLPIALDCLKDRDRERPSCHELCGHMSRLKASPKYTESVQQSQVNTQCVNRGREMQHSQQIQDFQQQLHTQQEQEIQPNQKILGLQNFLTAANDQLQTLKQQLTTKDKQLTGKNHQLKQKEAAIAAHQQEIQQLRQQLEKVVAEFQEHLEREMTQDQKRLQQQPSQREGQRREEVEASDGAANRDSIELTWRGGGRAPCKMYGEVAAVDGSVAYFRPGDVYSKRVFAYNSTNNEWSELSECPNYGFSLAVINSLLTAIGGKTSSEQVTNSLLTLTDEKWTEKFPPMPTKRWVTFTLCNGWSLVVTGGVGREGRKKLTTVEVMNTETLQWSTASNLPLPLFRSSLTLCGDQVYMLGGWDQDGGKSKSVFTCSLAALLQSCQPQSRKAQLKTSLTSRAEVWHQLADIPVTLSTYASLHGRLLAVGGCDSYGKMTTNTHMYNTTTNSWEVVSHMAIPRTQCLVAVLPRNELMVVGGRTSDGMTNSVEIATVVLASTV